MKPNSCRYVLHLCILIAGLLFELLNIASKGLWSVTTLKRAPAKYMRRRSHAQRIATASRSVDGTRSIGYSLGVWASSYVLGWSTFQDLAVPLFSRTKWSADVRFRPVATRLLLSQHSTEGYRACIHNDLCFCSNFIVSQCGIVEQWILDFHKCLLLSLCPAPFHSTSG